MKNKSHDWCVSVVIMGIEVFYGYAIEVDRCDQNTSNYCISMRSKKWWWALLELIPDMVRPNYLLLHEENKKSEDSTLDLLEFRRKIV